MPPASAKDSYLTDSVLTASPAELIVLLYERLELDLARADRALRSRPVALEAAHDALIHAQDVVLGLRASLRTEAWAAGDGLMAVYEWLSARLLQANLDKDPALVEECHNVVAPLAGAWRSAVSGAGLPTAIPGPVDDNADVRIGAGVAVG